MRRPVGTNRQEGQVAVLFAIAAIAIVATVGLAIDAGTSYMDQRGLQAASDTAATAGATMLAKDFSTCIASGSMPYTIGDITKVVEKVAEDAAAGSGKVTTLQEPEFLSYQAGATLQPDMPPTLTCGPGVSGSSGSWAATNPVAVEVTSANSHKTLVLQVIGIHNAEERATATADFGVFTAGAVAPFAACASSPLAAITGSNASEVVPGDTVLLANKQGSTGWNTVCNQAGSADFKGFFPCPAGSKPVCTIDIGSSTTYTSSGGSDCGQWPASPPFGVGSVVDVPLITLATGQGSKITMAVEGIIQVKISVDSCTHGGDFNLEGIVQTVGSTAGSMLVCTPGEANSPCSAPPVNVPGEAVGVQLVN